MRKRASREVGIADLKARLSEHLREVRRGRELIIKDRDTPVAKPVPIKELPFRIIPATRPSRGTDDMVGFCPTGVTHEDVERALAETRADRDDEWLSLDKSTSTRR